MWDVMDSTPWSGAEDIHYALLYSPDLPTSWDTDRPATSMDLTDQDNMTTWKESGVLSAHMEQS